MAEEGPKNVYRNPDVRDQVDPRNLEGYDMVESRFEDIYSPEEEGDEGEEYPSGSFVRWTGAEERSATGEVKDIFGSLIGKVGDKLESTPSTTRNKNHAAPRAKTDRKAGEVRQGFSGFGGSTTR